MNHGVGSSLLSVGPRVSVGVPIVIGYATAHDLNAAGGSLGLAGLNPGNTDNQMRAMVQTINNKGGILGHKIVLAPHDINTFEATSNPDATYGEACADWAEHKAFAVVNAGASIPSLLSCLKLHNIIDIDSFAETGATTYYGLPGFYGPSAMSVDRYMPALVDRLVAQHFFDGWDFTTGTPGKLPVKIGAQSFDTPDGHHYIAILRAALASHGLKLDDVEQHSTDLSANASSTQAAVLKFRSDGITHVFDANVLFYKDADNQGYHPRYAVDDTIATPALLAQNIGKSQLHGSMGAGYQPANEVPNPPDPTPATARCKKLMRDAGEDVSQSLVLTLSLQICDAISFLAQALTAGGSVSTQAMQAGAAELKGFESTATYGSTLTATRHEGANAVRDFEYSDACGCFTFTSTRTYRVP